MFGTFINWKSFCQSLKIAAYWLYQAFLGEFGPGAICHSDEATQSGLMSGKKISPNMLLETPATEESPDAVWQEKQLSVIGYRLSVSRDNE
ncbi:MAG: hypothetical protein MUD09_01380 [Desulfobacterales bacterium]|jgi:hypothetical protein|nr:hypothetical protein [Desulfobacterales bacterium]